ncbi:MAG: S-methyl-5-thioribose-1-phosphate isomerase [Candidatus Omnitrophica bacterium]|nr:S-methyl-5-thioribose-1-phosphate isomerase [Candidatus Omnitrophota bacterium]
MPLATIAWSKGNIKIIDQTKLPLKLEYIYCRDINALWKAIKLLKVRGAPALGAAAGLGVYLGIKGFKGKDINVFRQRLNKVISYLGSSRPTAVNLFWGLNRMRSAFEANKRLAAGEIKKALFREAMDIMEEDRRICRKMGAYGARLIKNGDSVLTVCNAGSLATVDYGTALGVLYSAKERGRRFKVYSCETRPLLQGARLTAWELKKNRVDVTLICDNTAASLMDQGKINKIIAGADRIAANGDAANKIGTYMLAVLAKFHNIPFYIAAPASTFDLKIKSGRQIPIEQRDAREVTELLRKRGTAPRGVKVYNPAFDVTPAGLITAIITEKGIINKPNTVKIKSLIG